MFRLQLLEKKGRGEKILIVVGRRGSWTSGLINILSHGGKPQCCVWCRPSCERKSRNSIPCTGPSAFNFPSQSLGSLIGERVVEMGCSRTGNGPAISGLSHRTGGAEAACRAVICVCVDVSKTNRKRTHTRIYEWLWGSVCVYRSTYTFFLCHTHARTHELHTHIQFPSSTGLALVQLEDNM